MMAETTLYTEEEVQLTLIKEHNYIYFCNKVVRQREAELKEIRSFVEIRHFFTSALSNDGHTHINWVGDVACNIGERFTFSRTILPNSSLEAGKWNMILASRAARE